MVKKEGKEIFYDARYFDNRLKGADRCVKTGHQTLGSAQMFAIKKSEDFGYCGVAETESSMIGEVPHEEILRRWGYLAGHEVDISKEIEAEKEAAIARAHKKLEVPKLETETQVQAAKAGKDVTKENNDMTDVTSADVAKATKGKPVTKVSPAAAKNSGKGATAAAAKAQKAGAAKKGSKAPAKKPAVAKEAKAPVGKPGSLLHSFGCREGSFRAGMVTILCENVGKMVPIKEVLKATYNTTNLEKIGALKMVIKGAEEMIKLNKIDYHIARGEDAKGDLTLGLKKGKA